MAQALFAGAFVHGGGDGVELGPLNVAAFREGHLAVVVVGSGAAFESGVEAHRPGGARRPAGLVPW